MKEKLKKIILDVVTDLYPEAGLTLDNINISYPPEQFGDYSCNVAMQLAGRLKKNPLEIAEAIKSGLEKNSQNFEKIEVAKPGYVNIFLSQSVLVSILGNVDKEAGDFGKSLVGEGKQVMVEFGQPNTHKAFHVGHLRSAISGLAVVKMYEALGYKVIKANYFGDVGMHVAKTTWAMSQTKLPTDIDAWDPHERMKFIDGKYVEGSQSFKDNPEAEKEIRQINKDIYAEKDTPVVKLYHQIREWSLEHLESVFAQLGVTYDRQYPDHS